VTLTDIQQILGQSGTGFNYPQMNTDVGAGSQISLTRNDMIHKPALYTLCLCVFVFPQFLDEIVHRCTQMNTDEETCKICLCLCVFVFPQFLNEIVHSSKLLWGGQIVPPCVLYPSPNSREGKIYRKPMRSRGQKRNTARPMMFSWGKNPQ
jgi:hypothetical protein